MRDRSAIVLVCLLVLSLPVTALGTAVGAPSGVADAQTASHGGHVVDRPSAAAPVVQASPLDDEETIHESLVLTQRPDRPGEFGAEATIAVPDAVRELEVSIPEEATVESTDGFDRVGPSTLEWTGETREASITLGVQANQTRGDGPHGSSADGYDFVETGEWGIVAVPRVSFSWRHDRGTEIGVERSVTVDGPGAIGDTIAVFGPVEEYVSDDGPERLRLVVPEAASLDESPDDILDVLGEAATSLAVGAANDEFFVVAAPTGTVEWRARGAQYGADDAWVRDDAALSDLPNVWLHEYVHSRQPFAGVDDGTTDELQWLIEGQADYYAALFALEQDLVDYQTFRAFLERGSQHPYDAGILADPSTWADPETDYARGPLALYAVDREIREATANDLTLVDALRDVTRADQPVGLAAYYAAVEDVGGADARSTAERYVETESIPDTVGERAHRDVFDADRTAFEVDVEGGPFAVGGDYRDGSVDALDEIVPGETVEIPVSVANVDDRAGHYSVFAAVDGEVVDEARGQLDAGEGSSASLSWTPETDGAFDVQIGEHVESVAVEPPVEATVTDLAVSSRAVSVGEPVTATITVTGDDHRPSAIDLVVTTPGGTADERTVRLAPGETQTVETTVSFDREGRNQLTAGDESVVVGVGTLAGLVVRGEAFVTSSAGGLAVGGLVVVLGLVAVGIARRRGTDLP
ncbi:peptidase [Halovivax gelatinilyticus]|uniref:peptidase n=1 Tax=Halovivax gelatinilyticus TaxID=2961597 RepID=UPI0020CA88EC|nr:peptidase [Halovivax gelatinilyticus]